jgi:epoxyqueuosine reductase
MLLCLPDQRLFGAYRLDTTRCISYLTFEHKGPIPHEFCKAIGSLIYGCDDHAVQLMSRDDLTSGQAGQRYGSRRQRVQSDVCRRAHERVGRSRLIRNVLTAIVNSRDPTLLALTELLKRDPDVIVAQAADGLPSVESATLVKLQRTRIHDLSRQPSCRTDQRRRVFNRLCCQCGS